MNTTQVQQSQNLTATDAALAILARDMERFNPLPCVTPEFDFLEVKPQVEEVVQRAIAELKKKADASSGVLTRILSENKDAVVNDVTWTAVTRPVAYAGFLDHIKKESLFNIGDWLADRGLRGVGMVQTIFPASEKTDEKEKFSAAIKNFLDRKEEALKKSDNGLDETMLKLFRKYRSDLQKDIENLTKQDAVVKAGLLEFLEKADVYGLEKWLVDNGFQSTENLHKFCSNKKQYQIQSVTNTVSAVELPAPAILEAESARGVEQLSPNCTMEVTGDTIHITVVSESMEGVEVQPYEPGEARVVQEVSEPKPIQNLAETLQAAAASNPNSALAVGIEAGNGRRNRPKGRNIHQVTKN